MGVSTGSVRGKYKIKCKIILPGDVSKDNIPVGTCQNCDKVVERSILQFHNGLCSNCRNGEVKSRGCLMCGKQFKSYSKGNRRCRPCKGLEEIVETFYKCHA
jgi:hypothetical protein